MEYVLQIFEVPVFGVRKITDAVKKGAAHIHDHFIPHHRNDYYPYALRHRSLGLLGTFLIVFKIFVLVLISVGPAIPAFSSAISVDNIISLTNQSRQDFNLPQLKENSLLDQAAQTKANDMLAKGYFSHDTPDGKTPWDFISAAGYNYITAGENLAVNFTQAENVESAWMNSPGHRANILDQNYQEIGIGISEGTYQGHDAIFVVQMFGTQIEQKITMLNKPTTLKPQTAAPAAVAQQAAVPAAVGVPQFKPASTSVSSSTPPAAGIVPQEISINNPQVNLSGQTAVITAALSSNVVKAMAIFGQQAVMMTPQSGGTWQGQVDISKLAERNLTVKLLAYDINGQSKTIQLADFSNGIGNNYNILGTQPAPQVSFFGKVFDPKSFAYNFYLYFIAAMLASLAFAIGIKRHILHPALVANTAFVIILAVMLWRSG